MNSYEDYLMDKSGTDYIDTLDRIIEYEENNKGMDNVHIEGTDFDVCWSYDDVGVSPQKLYQLTINGFLEKLFDSNSTTMYSLKDRERIKNAMDSMGVYSSGDTMEKIHNFPSEEELPDGLFDDIIGYDDVKWLLRRALTTDDIVNVILVGPPGSAKTIFLLAIESLENSMFVSGKPTSGPGVLDVMFKHTPKYMAIDEFDDMDSDTQQVLSQHMDTGILDETKYGKDRKMKTNTHTFASANSLDPVIDQIEDRFIDLHFEPYTRDEFIEICEHLLPRRESKNTEESRNIAKRVWEIEQSGDVRKAIAVARLSRGDPEKVLDVIDDYSGERGLLS